MFSTRWILAAIREAALCCIGSPHSRTRQLAALRKLDAHLLRDIGITPEEARRGFYRRDAAAKDSPRPRAGLQMRRHSLTR
jgi:uncharacterized protein YjiS (DUF1127 family)